MSMTTIPETIAIDGPAASGKSTLGFALAQNLGFLFFDTGLMYRAITWLVLAHNVDVQDEAAVTALAQNTPIDVRPASQDDGRPCDVVIEGQDVTWEIRQSQVEAHVSRVAAYPGVRQALSAQQRRIGLRGKVVMVGRDIGTVVLPDAALKIYLSASAEERARRRYDELIARGQTADYEQILAGVRERDRVDSTRALAPLRAAEDAVLLDSDSLTAEQVIARAEELWATR
jgi:CMP/dCMP kinase